MNELDGLARGCRDGQYESMAHAESVRMAANTAVSYIEEQFDSRNNHLRALTAKGSQLETIAFRSEETDLGVSVNFMYNHIYLDQWGILGELY